MGEIAYHYDSEYAGYVANVIVFSKFRGNGYGAKGLELLCTAVAPTDSGAPMKFENVYLDRPFVYMLIDCESNIPLFIGTLADIE